MNKAISSLLLLVLLSSISFASDELSEIKRTLADKSYANYWDRLGAINKLKKTNNKESAQVLISLFDDGEAPIREASVMALALFTDKAAIEHLGVNVLLQSRSEKQRYCAAWTLGLMNEENNISYLTKAMETETAENVLVKIAESIGKMPNALNAEEILIKKLSFNSKLVQAAIIKVLGYLGSEKSFPYVLKSAYNPDVNIKSAALEALAEIKKQDSVDYLESALKDPSPEVRITVLESLIKCKADKMRALKIASGLLQDKNLPVRIAAVQCLNEIRDKDCVSALVSRLGDTTWRLRYDIITALKDLTGQPFGFDKKVWLNWFEANKDRIEISPTKQAPGAGLAGNSNETIPTFFDIPILGKSNVFIIDFSGSMKADADGKNDQGDRKIDIAQRELSDTLKSLPADSSFNIIILSTEATRMGKRKMSKAMLPASDSNKKAGVEFVKSLWQQLEDIKRGRGDHYDALMEALSDPEVDTIFLLSDGKPTYGTYVQEGNIIENISRHNRFRKVLIHTITTGKTGTNVDLMRKLAEISNGIFVSK